MTVPTAKPPAAYLGGKRNLAKRLCALLEEIPHHTYVEPFVGMGGIFLRRSRPSAAEVINDVAGDVTNLFRVVRRHYQALVDEFAFLPASRDEFQRQLRLDPDALTDIERAVRFLYLQRLCFGGRIEGRSFGVRKDQSSRIQLGRLRADLRALSERLEPVTIERLDYAEVVRRYDSPRTLFYLDPPYDETEGYGTGFGRADYVAMADQLAGIAGQFVLSINDTRFIRETFAQFEIQEIATKWQLSARTSAGMLSVNELLIRSVRR